MGFLDKLKGFMKSDDTESSAKLMNIIAQMIADPKSGGVQGPIKLFQDSGFGEQMASWVSTEANLPISADQIKKTFGGGTWRKTSPVHWECLKMRRRANWRICCPL